MKRTHAAAAYDTWFRAQVQASIDDPRPSVDDETVQQHFARRREALRHSLQQHLGRGDGNVIIPCRESFRRAIRQLMSQSRPSALRQLGHSQTSRDKAVRDRFASSSTRERMRSIVLSENSCPDINIHTR